MDRVFPVLGGGARMALLQAVCAVAEHGQLNVCTGHETVAARVVRAVLRNTRSFSNLNGVAGSPRSLNSVYAAAVALFLHSGFRGRFQRALAKPMRDFFNGCIALTRDGCTLLVSDFTNYLHVINASSGLLIRSFGGHGTDPLQFDCPRQVSVASDGFVFVAELRNKRVQVLTPGLEFHAFINTECQPFGVCANHDIVAVSEVEAHRISIYGRHDGALRYRFGRPGSGKGHLMRPTGLCFLADGRQIACADYGNNRVSVFSVQGEFVKHVSCDDLVEPVSLAASGSDELFVDAKHRVVAFNAAGKQLQSIYIADVFGIALHDSTMYSNFFNSLSVQVFT